LEESTTMHGASIGSIAPRANLGLRPSQRLRCQAFSLPRPGRPLSCRAQMKRLLWLTLAFASWCLLSSCCCLF